MTWAVSEHLLFSGKEAGLPGPRSPRPGECFPEDQQGEAEGTPWGAAVPASSPPGPAAASAAGGPLLPCGSAGGSPQQPQQRLAPELKTVTGESCWHSHAGTLWPVSAFNPVPRPCCFDPSPAQGVAKNRGLVGGQRLHLPCTPTPIGSRGSGLPTGPRALGTPLSPAPQPRPTARHPSPSSQRPLLAKPVLGVPKVD